LNNKWKLLTTSLFVVGALTACNTDKDTAMENRNAHKMSTREYRNVTYRNEANRNVYGNDVIPGANPWDASRVGYYNKATGTPDGTADGTAMRRHVRNQLTGIGDNDITNHLRKTGTNESNRNREQTGITGTGTYPGAGMTNVGTTRSGAGATGTGVGMTGTGAGVGRTNGSGVTNIDMTRSGQIDGGTGTRDYNMNRVTNRYSNPDMTEYNRAYDANRVTNRGTKTDDYGNVKYSKVNQKMKQLGDKGPNYNYYGSRNYHGHLTNDGYPTRNMTISDYNVDGGGAAAEKIQNRVKGLRDVDRVAAVTYGDDILVAIKPRNGAATGTIENDVRRVAEPYAKGRTIHVTVTKTMYDRVRNMSNKMKNGAMTNEMNRDMTNLFRSIRTDYHRVVD
jgi:spore cortex protein